MRDRVTCWLRVLVRDWVRVERLELGLVECLDEMLGAMLGERLVIEEG